MSNDRFKFRAWFRDRWLHSYEKLGGCSISGETMTIGGWLSEVKVEDLNDVIIEQCTGLKDSNGKLIYEGDIVRMSHMYHECYCSGMCCECQPIKGDTVGVVALLPSEGYVLKNNHFIDDEGEFVAKRKKYCKLYSTHETYLLGNIHENPELLT